MPDDRVRGDIKLSLPTLQCGRIPTRRLMQNISIENPQTNALAFDRSVFLRI
jgi:hypothetical protein